MCRCPEGSWMEPWNEDGYSSPSVELWANRLAEECIRPTYFQRFRPQRAPRSWYRRMWTRRTWRLREALRGLRMGWKGELE